VALLGYGTIGSSLHRLLVEHRDHIRHATGRDVEVVAALVRDASRAREGIAGSSMQLVDDIDTLWAHDVQLVCEAMGGLEPARTYVLAALERGIPVCTANKQLVAHHGPELFAAAERCDAQLRFEASVCGSIPIIRMLRESLAAARIERVAGILNGTTNFILTAMTATGAAYGDALAEAQRLGYAEPDPTDDVTGVDAAAKLAILAGIAFHTRVPIESIATTGIDTVTAEDIAFASMLDCRVKLLGRAERVADGAGLLLDVRPVLVPTEHPLATVSGSTNAVQLTGQTFRELTIEGPGAGGPETASALAGDIVGVLGAQPSFLTRDPQLGECELAEPGARTEPFYVRMHVPDRPGVLATVAGAFGDQGISIERVVQQRADDGTAVLVLVTHPAAQPAIDAALGGLDTDQLSVLPILDAADAA
jgi:homoserine dehydrogenase